MALRGHQLTDDRWARYGGVPAAAVGMTGTVKIMRGDGAPANNGSGWSKTTPTQPAPSKGVRQVWAGPARAQPQASAALTADVADQNVTTRLYLVQLPLDVPALRASLTTGDVVVFTACVADPQLVGRQLRIIDVQHATATFTRDVMCSDSLTLDAPPLGA